MAPPPGLTSGVPAKVPLVSSCQKDLSFQPGSLRGAVPTTRSVAVAAPLYDALCAAAKSSQAASLHPNAASLAALTAVKDQAAVLSSVYAAIAAASGGLQAANVQSQSAMANPWPPAPAPVLPDAIFAQALGILDRAILNSQRAKALERIIVSAQVCEEQRCLMAKLQSLREASGLPDRVGARLPDGGLYMGTSGADTAQIGGYRGGAVPAGPPPAGACRLYINSRSGATVQPSCSTSQPAFEKPPPIPGNYKGPGQVQAMTLSMSLQLLSHEDPNCLFIVRRINKLGFKAARKLKQHFATHGHVVKVLVAHSTVRQNGDVPCQWRRRPSSLGFVHMATAASVKQVLSQGAEQEVDGCMICVQQFQRQQGVAGGMQEVDEADEDCSFLERGVNDFERQQSHLSGASTATGSTSSASSESETGQVRNSNVQERAGRAKCGLIKPQRARA